VAITVPHSPHSPFQPRLPLAPAAEKSKTVFVKTFGCQMNVYDSERMTEALSGEGYAETANLADADLIILNTCHIREKAAEKVYSELGRIRAIKERRIAAGADTVVAVMGCVAQAEGAEILARAPAVDLVVGPQSYHRLVELLRDRRPGAPGIVETAFPDEDKFAHLPVREGARPVSAFLTVQEGCDKFCTFCVVPYTRGVEFSRPVADIVREAERLVLHGAREITLLGQNVNAYHGEGPDGRAWTLGSLAARLAEIDGLERLRYTTSHPRDMRGDLIAAHRDVPKLMPYLHLPFQSGSDRILAAMNRKHTVADYVALVARVRAARPDIALSTDIIVGFPGETEAEFQATADLVERIGFAQAYSFKYSPRIGTPAAKIEGQIPEPVKAKRLERLQPALDRAHLAYNSAFAGKRLPVLFERPARTPGQFVGRSPYMQMVVAEAGPDVVGRVIEVAISAAGPNSLSGVIDTA